MILLRNFFLSPFFFSYLNKKKTTGLKEKKKKKLFFFPFDCRHQYSGGRGRVENYYFVLIYPFLL